MYNIQTFLRNHITDTITFYTSMYNSLHYSAIARENNIEGLVDVVVINHSDSLFETCISDPRDYLFLKNLHETISRSRKQWRDTDIPFILKLSVNYQLISRKKVSQDSVSASDFHVKAFSIYEEREPDYVYNLNEIASKPRIIGNPYFRNHKRILKSYMPIESLEQLLEEAVRACCHKKIEFQDRKPPPPHSVQVNFSEPKVYLSLFFHPKGYIYDVRLSGPLAQKLDAVALKSVLKDVRFLPALVDNTPVYAILEFASK